MLNALALGARELASLSIPPPKIAKKRIAFPSKVLPPALHQKYLGSQSDTAQLVPLMLNDISREALDRGNENTIADSPALVRERRLRVQKPRTITEVDSIVPSKGKAVGPSTFNDVAVEFFIAPIINRFWLFLRDEQTREDRTSHLDGRQRYQGTGTGLILSPIVLAQFLSTLAVLVHAAHNAPEWLAIVGPDALEVAVTMGTKPVSLMELNEDDSADEDSTGIENRTKGKEASVLTAALELALVVLDAALELDAGRSLGLEHTPLVMGAGEWAGGVFARLDKGLKVEGGGGLQEIKLNRAAAGVLLKVDAIISKWRRSMIATLGD